jgi:hypothetical protein
MLEEYRAADIVGRLADALPAWNASVGEIQLDHSLRTLPNPLTFLREDMWSGVRAYASAPEGLIHGDLHTGNVITAPHSGRSPKIIDLSDYRPDGVPFFDLAYLEFDIIRKYLPISTAEARRQWLELLDCSMQDVLPSRTKSGGTSIDFVLQALAPCRHLVRDIQQLYNDDSGLVWWLATVASGLNYARKGDLARPPLERVSALIYASFGMHRVMTILGMTLPNAASALQIPWIEAAPSSDLLK